MPDNIASGFTFSTPVANGRGFFNVTRTGGEWKASTVFMALDDLKARKNTWQGIETDVQVLIVGVGQNGLQIAARFRQMQVSALVIERNDCVGDIYMATLTTLFLFIP
ncbi:hypothetical protein D9757_013769 [Collybiopsis confluens]|uniref:FAD/NAD(P)-binding domain-containing protein n=1 Tax=Collybiopsis confluens TaxID=2823264 RepID=A0A8H5FUW2_9AGAR|nr:hypothetical protein D9757_013769 [Collybiopsis confluens]